MTPYGTRWAHEEVEDLHRLAGEGLGAAAIAERMGLEESRVRSGAKTHGVLIPHVHDCTVACIRRGRAPMPELEEDDRG